MDSRRTADDRGFTLVELVVAVGLAAFVFAALASVLVSSTKVVGIQKSRTQGNDLATLAIEDLQRLGYNNLILCPTVQDPVSAEQAALNSAWTAKQRPELADTATPISCPSVLGTAVCAASAPPPATAVPRHAYKCTRRNIEYSIFRYIAFGDIPHTEKKLAVVVGWQDQGGRHEVAQQSSLRIPAQNAVVGNPPPTVNATGTDVVAATSPIPLNPDRTNSLAIQVVARVAGVGSSDQVVAVVDTVTDSNRQQQSVSLLPDAGDPTTWRGTIAAGSLKFGSGAQNVVITATRITDGKVNSLVKYDALRFSPPAPHPPTVSAPTFTPNSSTMTITPAGDLTTSFTVSVDTTNISPEDQVAMTFETQTGAVSVSMSPTVSSWAGGCIPGACNATWTATVTPAAGYHFFPSPPDRHFYFVARQVPAGSYAVDSGATAVSQSAGVTFSNA